jgi:hypothetical protein
MFTLQTIFDQAGGGVKSVSRGDCEQQEGKLIRLCPNYVQEFGLWTASAQSH